MFDEKDGKLPLHYGLLHLRNIKLIKLLIQKTNLSLFEYQNKCGPNAILQFLNDLEVKNSCESQPHNLSFKRLLMIREIRRFVTKLFVNVFSNSKILCPPVTPLIFRESAPSRNSPKKMMKNRESPRSSFCRPNAIPSAVAEDGKGNETIS